MTIQYGSQYSSTELQVNLGHKQALLRCDWKLNGGLKGTPCRTLDVSLLPVSIRSSQNATEQLSMTLSNGKFRQKLSLANASEETSVARSWFVDIIKQTIAANGSQTTGFKLLLPNDEGYIMRNDVIERRFLKCDLAKTIVHFVAPRQHVTPFNASEKVPLLEALDAAIGAILLHGQSGSNRSLQEFAQEILEIEIRDRLSFPWIAASPLHKKRLAVLEGRSHPDKSDACKGPLRAAAALGIELVILDEAGHWLQDAANAHLRDEFIECDINVDEGLPDRVVAALQTSKGPIDGIVTFSDKLLHLTAKAARKLGLETYPVEAIEVCINKAKTRQIASKDSNFTSIENDQDVDLLRKRLAADQKAFSYPLIVKPAMGNSSEGVSKADDGDALLQAVLKIRKKFPKRCIVVEPYVSGPEVDANFVLKDGQLMFSEINDDFPSTADFLADTASGSFAEQATIIPTRLPPQEVSMLQRELTECLDKLGFRSGIFHLEARVKDSSMAYSVEDSAVELHERAGGQQAQASSFLIEINARTPGHQESFAVEYTWGVDYYALYMLLALVEPGHNALQANGNSNGHAGGFEKVRDAYVRALSQPFPEHARFPTNLVFVPVTRGGKFISASPLPDSLMSHVVWHRTMIQEGTVVEDPTETGQWPFIACFVVMASSTGAEGREQVRSLGEQIKQEFQYVMV